MRHVSDGGARPLQLLEEGAAVRALRDMPFDLGSRDGVGLAVEIGLRGQAIRARHAVLPRRLSTIAISIPRGRAPRSEEHTSELQSLAYLVCRLLLEKKKQNIKKKIIKQKKKKKRKKK